MNNISNISKVQQIFDAMKNLEVQAKGKLSLPDEVDGKTEKFSSILIKQLDYVNGAQQKAEELQDKFTLGDASVSLAQVKAAELKASVYTQGLVNVRNKVVDAYKEIMNMSI